MGVYRGTGYFISMKDLKEKAITNLLKNYPDILNVLLKDKDEKPLDENASLYDLLKACHYITTEPIIQYDECVCFAGVFKKFFDEDHIDPESGDAEMVEQLKADDGYAYAVSNEEEKNHVLETLEVLLKASELLSDRIVLETYWFLMPFGA